MAKTDVADVRDNVRGPMPPRPALDTVEGAGRSGRRERLRAPRVRRSATAAKQSRKTA